MKTITVCVKNRVEADALIPKAISPPVWYSDEPTGLRVLVCGPIEGPLDLGAWIGTHNCDECYSGYVYDTQGERFFPDECDSDEDGELICPRCGEHGCVAPWDSWMGRPYDGPGLHWVICFGGGKPVHPDWVRSLRDQCVAAGVPFAFLGWGDWAPLEGSGAKSPTPIVFWRNGQWRQGLTSEQTAHMVCVGTEAAGRELDGKVWDQRPESRA